MCKPPIQNVNHLIRKTWMCTNQLLNSTSVHLQEYTAVELLESTNVQKLSQSENDESDYDDKVVEVEKKVLAPGELKCTFVDGHNDSQVSL